MKFELNENEIKVIITILETRIKKFDMESFFDNLYMSTMIDIKGKLEKALLKE